jgi:hypothetical protein
VWYISYIWFHVTIMCCLTWIGVLIGLTSVLQEADLVREARESLDLSSSFRFFLNLLNRALQTGSQLTLPSPSFVFLYFLCVLYTSYTSSLSDYNNKLGPYSRINNKMDDLLHLTNWKLSNY